ncbi:glycosyltransferase [Niameybacter massiliensis]|uniref:Glycosyltransferase n=1 Tax=Holtiella tumoricola TaxID=3018743 RepID=A0AA42J253_9FIRM|nr:glycosyltransferase [Holtiella tumoricola]MDA3733217.1 glycosyltransferase [Holtiella tumoricola]
MNEINSLGWWNEYFQEQWEENSGKEQTTFFVNIALEHISTFIKKDIIENKYSICDFGCALGQGTNILKQAFTESRITGIDYSSEAIKKAKSIYKELEFLEGSINDIDSFDIIFTSNTLEHFENPISMIEGILAKCKRYFICMVPFEEYTRCESHLFTFEKESFPKKIGDFDLVASEIIDCRQYASRYWEGKQILVIYKNKEKESLNTVMKDKTNNDKVRIWDRVAEGYITEITNSDIEIANKMTDVLDKLGIDSGSKLLELGCGSGHISAMLGEKGYNISLLDFSPVAIEKSKQVCEKYNIEATYYEQDFFKLKDIETQDVIWNSGVLEHFDEKELKVLLKQIKTIGAKYFIFLVPNVQSLPYLLFRYHKMAHEEWEYDYEYLRDNYECIINSVGMKVIHTQYLAKELTNYLFSVGNKSKEYIQYLNEMNKNGLLPTEQLYLKMYVVDMEGSEQSLEIDTGNVDEIKYKTDKFDLISKVNGYKHEIKELNEYMDKQLKQKELEVLEKDNELKRILEQLAEADEVRLQQKKEQENQLDYLQKEIEQLKEVNNHNINQLSLKNDEIQKLVVSCQDKEEKINFTKAQIKNYEETLKEIYDSHLWRVGLKYYRIRDKFPLTKWIHGVAKKKRLQKNLEMVTNEQANSIDNKVVECKNIIEDINEQVVQPSCITMCEEQVVNQSYTKQDIILLSVIDWDFRFQRPQHLAKNLAKLGHRVFYFNANYISPDVKVKNIDSNLFEVTLGNSYGERIYDIEFEQLTNESYKKEIRYIMDRYNIREANIIVEYPTWEPVARYMKEIYGFKIAFDYIDDYTGFEETNNSALLVHTKRLLKISDLTIATSLFLQEKASQYSNNVTIIRNGTEFEFFNKAYRKNRATDNRPKIGYYGAIAEWFDVEKIAYIAKNKPDYDIELIGHVSSNEAEILKQYKNVKFLGEKDYKSLPKYLKEYDVCLIPFQSDIDLIKATNPVKFYEYLSAGKKIVATEIPELEPFKDEYVYLANENETFLRYVEMCVEERDTLKSPEELREFAKTHDWQARCEVLEDELKQIHPLVSIILVTYNNLHYTKQCMESLLNKTAYPNYEVIIVDNDSKDDTPNYLKQLEREQEVVKVILNDNNSGFAGGNNIGIRASHGDYIILLNNDTLVTRGWVTSLIKHLDKEKIGMVGPVTNSIGNESQINIGYKTTETMDKFAIQYTTQHQNEIYQDIKVLAMFCVAIKRDLMEEVGLLDENYKVGMFEDDDYSMAITQKGYEVVCVEDTFIHHFGNASFKKLEDKRYQEIFNHNKNYFEGKWNVVWTPHKYREGVNI